MNRRTFVHATASSLGAHWLSSRVSWRQRGDILRLSRPLPSPSQLAWQRDELAMFLHFGVNTFTDREWGDGTESPTIFDPARLDARQWARTARVAGFRSMILTAKHHDGFCLWPSRTTDHSVAKSPFRGGQGDVVREFVDACAAEGLRAGLYLSPWDRNNPRYGDSPRYNDLYCDQLTELMLNYGKIGEVWFDGANGEGPNGRKQVYDWPRVFTLVKRHQPEAVIFSDAGPDVRWCGNENGSAGEPNWSTVDPSVVTFPGASGPAIGPALQHGDPAGTVWRPAECDTSIRPGWFYHPADDARVRSADNLYDLCFKSVGRNGKLLLNVPPTRDGLLHDVDVARLSGFNERMLEMKEKEFSSGGKPAWRVTGPRTAEAVLDLGRSAMLTVARLGEDISRGQSVAKYTLYGSDMGDWSVLARGTTIGYAKLDRFAPTRVSKVKLVIDDAVDAPDPVSIAVYAGA